MVDPPQPSLGLLDVVVERNAYGRQVDSFEARAATRRRSTGPCAACSSARRASGRRGPAVEVLARLADEPVLVRQGRVLAATFHPELAADDRLHRRFLAEA